MPEKPYVKVISQPGASFPENSEAVFALRLENIVSIVIDNYYRHQVITQQRKSQVDFINSLYNSENKFAYELRYISRKVENQYYENRKLEVVLQIRVSSPEAEKEAAELSSILPLIQSSRLSNYEFCPVINQEDFKNLINPFDIKYLAEIRRRHQKISISTLKKGVSAGFLPGSGSFSADADCAYYVFPFIHRENEFSEFIRMMLDINQNLIVSCLLIPTTLENNEFEFMNQQVARCEKARSSYSEDSQSYRDRAAGMISVYEDQISKLLDAPFLMQIRIASDEPINPSLMEAIGVEITEYQGLKTTLASCYYSGGYDVVFPTDEELPKSISAFQRLEPYFFSHPKDYGRWRFLYDALEASCAFRLPLAINDNLVGLKVIHVKPLPLPKDMKSQIYSSGRKTKIGIHSWSGQSSPVYLSDVDRLRHVYTIGQTGTGKTTLLKNMILEDLKKGDGIIVIDPHGDFFYELLGLIPKKRINEVVILNPMDTANPVGLNLLEWQTKEEKYFLIKEIQEIIRRMMEDEYGQFGVEMTGPIFYHYVEMVLLLVMSHPKKKATIYDFFEIFQSNDAWKKWVVDIDNYDDPNLKNWVENQLPKVNFLERDKGTISIGEYVSGKFKDFIFDPKLREIFNQETSTINIKEIMDSGKILLVNLAKGELAERNSRFLGMVLMAKIMGAAMERIKLPKEKRKSVYIYVDEFQNIATGSFNVLLSEARKFGVGLVLANQFLSQIKQRNIIDAIFGNVSTFIAFRVGLADAGMLDDVFMPTISRNDLINLPNWQAAVRTSVNGLIVTPFYIRTERSERPDENIRLNAVDSSRKKYGRKIEC